MRAILALLLICGTITVAPARGQAHPTPAQRDRSSQAPEPATAETEQQKQLAKQRNQERFRQLKKDTDQLLDLATQLKKYVDETSDQKLSMDVIRKAEQIEKLAKQVRQKMAGE